MFASSGSLALKPWIANDQGPLLARAHLAMPPVTAMEPYNAQAGGRP
jgi:hypothetical protein